MVESALVASKAGAERRRSSRFFPIAATVFLLIVVLAFSRTFFFRPLLEIDDLSTQLGERSLPPHLVLHGLILTSWYTIFCVQAWLVARRNLAQHKSLGLMGAGVSAAVVLSGAWTAMRYVARASEAGGRPIELVSSITIGGLVGLVGFSLTVGMGIYFRHIAAVHKRLMFFSALWLIGPATAGGNRAFGAFLAKWFSGWPIDNFMFVLAVAIAALITFDLTTTRRVHIVTAIFAPAIVLMALLARSLSASQAGQDFIRWLA